MYSYLYTSFGDRGELGVRLGEVGGEVEGEGVELVLRLALEMEGTSRRLEVDI